MIRDSVICSISLSKDIQKSGLAAAARSVVSLKEN